MRRFNEAAWELRQLRRSNPAEYERRMAERAERSKARAEARAKMITGTCQICARTIGAETGKIAHHGYKRPGEGWQTPSCMGARFLPYEQSRDRIPVVLAAAKSHLVHVEQNLRTLLALPAEFRVVLGWDGRPRKEVLVLTKPADLTDALQLKDPKCGPYHNKFRVDTYEQRLSEALGRAERGIRETKNTIAFLQKRYDSWVPPATA